MKHVLVFTDQTVVETAEAKVQLYLESTTLPNDHILFVGNGVGGKILAAHLCEKFDGALLMVDSMKYID
jgi:hypothetical protein